LIRLEPIRPTRVVGLGCQRGCTAQVLRELITQHLHTIGLALEDISALASIDKKADEPGLLQLAAELGLTLSFFSAEQLSKYEAHLSHRSLLAFEHSGCYGVAESAALALAAETGPAHLLITRQKCPQATFALAITLPIDR
jgi:cobalt-precorrin 5A hydrolase